MNASNGHSSTRGRRGAMRGALATLSLVVFVAWPNGLAYSSPRAATLMLHTRVGPPTTSTNTTGSGFGASEIVDLSFDDVLLATAVTNATGTFRKQITVPEMALPGPHTVQAEGQTSGLIATAIFTVRTDWTHHRFSSSRSGTNPYENVITVANAGAFALEWSGEFGTTMVRSSPVVAQLQVVVGADDSTVRAYSAPTGQQRWVFTVDAPVFASPAVDKNQVFVGSDKGTIYALSLKTGAKLWSLPLGESIVSSPAVAFGTVYVGVAGAIAPIDLVALKETTGDVVWQADLGAPIQSSPAIVGKTIYVGDDAAVVHALEATTGVEIWKTALGGDPITSSIVVDQGILFVGLVMPPRAELMALDAASGEVLWSTDIGTSARSSPAVAEGIAYIGTDDHLLYALNTADGSVVWTADLGGQITSSPSVANGVVFAGAEGAGYFAIDALTGEILWQESGAVGPMFSSPAIADGRVFIGSDDGSLLAFAPTE